MTAVEFHTGIPDPVVFACRLLRKAYRLGSRVQVTAAEPLLNEIDRALWADDASDFVPHARTEGAAQAVLQRTLLWLSVRPQALAGLPAPGVLVNVGGDIADLAQQYERVIEVVGIDPDMAEAGRSRWKRYKAEGLEVLHRTAG